MDNRLAVQVHEARRDIVGYPLAVERPPESLERVRERATADVFGYQEHVVAVVQKRQAPNHTKNAIMTYIQ